MKKIKRFKAFLEDGSTGMGSISNAQPGDLPGQPGTIGSGDVSFYMLNKKGKNKKGTPSEVSDARYLEPAKGITKVKEAKLGYSENLVVEQSYNDIQEYINQIITFFKEYNIRAVVLNHILHQYQLQISEYYEEGKDPKLFVDEIVKDMELDYGGFMANKVGSAGYNKVIKYL